MPTVASTAGTGKTLKDTPFFHILEITPAQRRRQYLSLATSLVIQLIVLVSFGPILRPVPLRAVRLVHKDYVFLHLPTPPGEKENPQPQRPRPATRPPIQVRPQPDLTPPSAALR